MNSMIIEKLKNANVITNTGFVILENLEQYVLTHDVLVIMYDDTVNNVTGPYLRAVIEKWTFQDKAMGEQFITFDFLSEQPVAWAVNDYCFFRGERYSLNYIPSVSQRGSRGKILDAYKYESVKMDSLADELTRCQMLDVVLSDYDPDAGTNYTGSSQFTLFCGETTVEVQGEPVTRTAVMTLGDRILANLNRMYQDGQGHSLWSIVYGADTHTEDQMLTFDNQSVAQALAEVKNKFDLDYAIKGRTIYIGCELGDVADVEYGYGQGYPTEEAGGKGLFEIKKISDSSQQIVTRLRVLGSTKNIPYRYYNNKYNLPQALFPTNLQLPDTFIQEGSPSDPAGTNSKWGHNKQRTGLRAVKGATNDAYIDKNDDAAGTPEGIRESTVRFDGSDSKLKEIYPTIENVTYDELRGSHAKDQSGNDDPSTSFPNYEGTDRVDELMAIGYKADGVLIDDANIGSGIMSEDMVTKNGTVRDISCDEQTASTRYQGPGTIFIGDEVTLFTVTGQEAGAYFFTPVTGKEPYYSFQSDNSEDAIGYMIRVKKTNPLTEETTVIATYYSPLYSNKGKAELPSIPDAFFMDDAQVKELLLTETSDITVTLAPLSYGQRQFTFRIGSKKGGLGTGQYVWSSVANMDSSNATFHVFLKDFVGENFAAQFNGDTPTINMKSGKCVGRAFQIVGEPEKVTYDGKAGWLVTLSRDQDTSLNTYYPNANYEITAGDLFVITGIDMPDNYISAAELRLLAAATDWLANNGDTHFRYQPSIDDIYLKRNYDNMVALQTPGESVFWKLYAGYKLTFKPIPDNPSSEPSQALSVTIESVAITMGNGLTRKVEIMLNDELKESTIKKVSREVKDLNSKIQSFGTGMSSIVVENTVRRIGDQQYLSKVENDTAAGDITFNGTINFSKDALFEKGAYFGRQTDGSFGADIDQQGNIHSKKNIYADGGVAAHGIPNLNTGAGGGGQGDVSNVIFDPGVPYTPNTPYTPVDNTLRLPVYPSLAGIASQEWVAANFAGIGYESRVEAIEALIPSQATSLNQLADKAFVNSSIATATATYQGSYNLVSDLSLTTSATREQIASALADAIVGEDNNDYAFVEIPTSDSTPTQIASVERYKFNGTAWAYEYTLNNSGMTAAQWAVLNSGITASGVALIYSAIQGVKVNGSLLTPDSNQIVNVGVPTALSQLSDDASHRLVTDTQITAWGAKYDLPSGGIPKTDLASAVQTSLGLADTALQTVRTLTIQKNGATIDTFDPTASANKTINISDVASASTLANYYSELTDSIGVLSNAIGAVTSMAEDNTENILLLSGRADELESYFTNGMANNAARLSNTTKIGDTNQPVYFTANGVPAAISYTIGRNVADNEDVTPYTPATNGNISVNNHTIGISMTVTPDPTSSGTDISFIASVSQDSYGKISATKKAVRAANASQSGVVDTLAQTFAGDKTFNGNVQSMKGVAAHGIANLAINAAGGSGDVTSIKFGNGSLISASDGLLAVPVGQGTSNGQINIGGQDVSVKGLGTFAYISSLAFADLTNKPTTLSGYGITDAKIANGVITLGGNSITPLTSHQTLYNLVINNSAGTAQITYKPGVSGTYALTLTKAMVGLGNVENTALSTWTGSTNITTLGTITTGTWKGTAIADNYIASAATWNAKQDAISDLSTIRSRADEGHTAYGWGNHADAGYFAASSFTKANIKSTLGISDWALAASKPSYAFSEITGTVTNAQLAGSIANSKLASAGKFTIGSTAIELGTTYTAANFRSYLGLGGAATYGATSSVTDGGTSLVTSGGVYSYVNALLTAAMKIEGETTTAISDGSTTNPVTIGGESVSAYKGMVVFYGSMEFVWVGTNWKELGDESSFALKTTTVSGTGYLTGGGALSANQTLDIASSVKTMIDNGATAYGWGNHASAGYVKTVKVGNDSYSPTNGVVSLPAYPYAVSELVNDLGFTANTGTVTSVTIKGSGAIVVDYETAITGIGTRTISHATSGATAGSYGDSAAQTPAYGGTFKVPYVTVDAQGHVTAISEHTVKIPASDNTWRPLGTGANDACAGNDSRLSDARTPVAHASSATTYGVGTTSLYGHVKLATGDMNGANGSDGVAVGKNHTHSQYALAANLGTASTHAHGDYVTAITYDSTNRKLQQSKGGGTATDIVQFGTNAFNSTAYLPLAGGTMANTGLVTNLNADLFDGHHYSEINDAIGVLTNSVGQVSSMAQDNASNITLLDGRASDLESYFTNGVANNAARLSNTSAIGSITKPVYFTDNGVPSACSDYAGGTAVTLNGSSKAANTASFYAPTGAGTSGQILKSTAGTPEWINQSAITAGALTTVSKTAWGRTYWTSGGVPDNISGDMSNVGNIAFQASGKNIGGIAYFDTTNSRLGIGTSSPSYKLHVTGDIYAQGGWLRTSGSTGWYSETYGGGWFCDDYTYVKTYGNRSIYTAADVLAGGNIVGTKGVASQGIANLSVAALSGSNFVTQVKIGSTAYNPSDGIVSLPAYPTVPTALSGFTNDVGYITNVTGNQVTNALGYVPARKQASTETVTGNIYDAGSKAEVYDVWIPTGTTATFKLPYDPELDIVNYVLVVNNLSSDITVSFVPQVGTAHIIAPNNSLVVPAGKAIEVSYLTQLIGSVETVVLSWSALSQYTIQ